MSYPRKLHILIIEDEQDPIDGYRELLKAYRDDFPSVEPTIARSYADAEALLKSSCIFHCVILDLNLPLANREQPPGGLAPGQQLLELAANRDDYPIPVLLIVSGKLSLASLTDLQHRLARSFWHGAMINKGHLNMPDEIRKGLQKANEYADVGIHIQDSGNNWFPTLAPREEDLLRRCILAKPGCIGVDLEWWSAEQGPSLSHPSVNDGPTKVLMGRFLLDDGLESSRPTFFKFEPAGNSEFVCRDVAILDHKLSHVKVQHSAAARSRCLLVTQSVTDSRPVSLDRLLTTGNDGMESLLPQLVADIATQLDKLGGLSEDQIPASEVLWKHHRLENLKAAYALADSRMIQKDGAINPLTVFEELHQCAVRLWVSKRACIHGDLNASNVAVDMACEDRPHAYIFDAAGIHVDVDTRDCAVLELTTLLFSGDNSIVSHLSKFRMFYEDKVNPGPVAELATLPPSVRNATLLLSAIRNHVSSHKNPETYPLVLFDTIMLQLGGLAVQPKRNKIVQPQFACMLAAWIATWLKSSLPQLFPASTPPTETAVQ